MEKQIVDKTSFSEICKILKDNKYDICLPFQNCVFLNLTV